MNKENRDVRFFSYIIINKDLILPSEKVVASFRDGVGSVGEEAVGA